MPMYTNKAYTILLRFIFCSALIVFLCAGCEKQPETQEEQKVASKKIVMAKKDGAKADADQKEQSSPDTAKGRAAAKENTKKPAAPLSSDGVKIDGGEQKTVAAPKIEPKIEKKVTEGQAAIKKPGPDSSKGEIPVAYIYNPAGKIDPFATIFKEQPKEIEQEVKKM